jgi:hypothetical protein
MDALQERGQIGREIVMLEITASNAPIIFGLMALAMALVRLAERLVDGLVKKRNGKKSLAPAPAGGCRGLTQEEHAALMRLDEQHDKHDQDGTPLWYVPRSWGSVLEKIVETQDRTSVRLRDVVKIQKDILDKMKRWEDNTGTVAVPSRRR